MNTKNKSQANRVPVWIARMTQWILLKINLKQTESLVWIAGLTQCAILVLLLDCIS